MPVTRFERMTFPYYVISGSHRVEREVTHAIQVGCDNHYAKQA